MFGIGMPEMLLILAVALIVIGPKKLPDLAKSMGKALGEFKRATNDLKQSIEQETGMDEVRDSLNEVNRDIKTSMEPPEIVEAIPPNASEKPEGASDPADQTERQTDPDNPTDDLTEKSDPSSGESTRSTPEDDSTDESQPKQQGSSPS